MKITFENCAKKCTWKSLEHLKRSKRPERDGILAHLEQAGVGEQDVFLPSVRGWLTVTQE